jgi:dihydrofolate synthase/folylpolyglutamate synthase
LQEALPYRRFWEPHTEKIYLSDLPGDYQGVNLRTALQVVQVLRTQGWTIPETAVEKGLQYAAQTAPLWGRTQWILHEKSPILLEVAHNPQGFAALRKLLEKAPYQIEIALIGFSADKDYRGALSQLQGLPIEIWAVAAQNPRALAPAEITRTAQQLGFSAQEAESTISQTLLKALSCGKPILVAGSIFVVAEALAALRTNPQQQNPMNTLTPRPR